MGISKKLINGVLVVLTSQLASQNILAAEVTETPAKIQKYNGYGIPNTKFKKIKIDLSKKSKKAPTQASDMQQTMSDTPISLYPPIAKTTENTTSTAKITPNENALKPKFGFNLTTTYNTQAEKQADNSQATYLLHEINPTTKIEKFLVAGYFYYYDDIKEPSANEWQDSFALLTHDPFELGTYFTLTPATSFTFPLSKKSREFVGAKYSAGASLALGLNTKNLNIPSFSLNYSLGYSKMTTEYTTNTKGEPVTSYRIRQRVNLGYQFTDKLSFKTRFQFDSAYSTENVVRNNFLHFQVFEYQVNDHLGLNLAHTNENKAFLIKESEQDYYLKNNVKFYDPESSEYSIGLTLSI